MGKRRPPSLEASAGNLRGSKSGGARRDRTDDLLLAKQALSQLSYGPFRDQISVSRNQAALDICYLIADT
jgi:hypothetical protein